MCACSFLDIHYCDIYRSAQHRVSLRAHQTLLYHIGQLLAELNVIYIIYMLHSCNRVEVKKYAYFVLQTFR